MSWLFYRVYSKCRFPDCNHCFFFKHTGEKISIKNWNNGVCPIDGTHWVYNNSSVSNGWTTNFYRCENGHITKTYGNFTPNN